MGKRLYVGNIPFQTTEAQLRTLFEQDGAQVSEVKIVLDRETGRPRGFAFVELSTDSQASGRRAGMGALLCPRSPARRKRRVSAIGARGLRSP